MHAIWACEGASVGPGREAFRPPTLRAEFGHSVHRVQITHRRGERKYVRLWTSFRASLSAATLTLSSRRFVGRPFTGDITTSAVIGLQPLKFLDQRRKNPGEIFRCMTPIYTRAAFRPGAPSPDSARCTAFASGIHAHRESSGRENLPSRPGSCRPAVSLSCGKSRP